MHMQKVEHMDTRELIAAFARVKKEDNLGLMKEDNKVKEKYSNARDQA